MKAVSKALRLKVTNSKGQVSNVLSVKRIKGIILLSCEEIGFIIYFDNVKTVKMPKLWYSCLATLESIVT